MGQRPSRRWLVDVCFAGSFGPRCTRRTSSYDLSLSHSLSLSLALSLSLSLPLLQHTLSPSRSLALLLSCSVLVSLILVYVQSYAESTRGVMTTRKHKRCLPANAPHSNQATVPLIHRRYSTTAVRVLTTLACRSCQGENRQVTTMLTTTLASLAER